MRLFLFAYATQWLPGHVVLSRFTISLSFRCAPLIGNVLRLKMPLKYGTRICELVQLHIGCWARRHFYRLFDVFFFSLQLPCPCLYGPRYSLRPYLYGARYTPRPCSIARSWLCSPSSWRRAALMSFTTFAMLAAPLIKDPSAPNIDRNGNASPRFAEKVSAFSSSSFSSVSCPCRSWSWLSSLTRRQLRLLSRSKSNLSRRALYRRVPCPPRVYRWDRCSENTQCRVLGTPRPGDLCPRHLWLISLVAS